MQFIQSTFFQREKNPTTRTHVQFNSEEKSVAIQVALSTKKNNGKMSEVPQISSHRQQNPQEVKQSWSLLEEGKPALSQPLCTVRPLQTHECKQQSQQRSKSPRDAAGLKELRFEVISGKPNISWPSGIRHTAVCGAF